MNVNRPRGRRPLFGAALVMFLGCGLYAPGAHALSLLAERGGPEHLLASYEMDFVCVPDIHFEAIFTVADGPHVLTEVGITGTRAVLGLLESLVQTGVAGGHPERAT